MFRGIYSSRRAAQQDRASSSSTSSSQTPRSLDQARSAGANNSSSRRQSAANQSTSGASRRTNSSRYPGVRYSQTTGRWIATYSSNGRRVYVGSFDTQVAAESAIRERQEMRSIRVLQPSLAAEEDRSGALSRVSQSNIFGNSSERSVEISADDQSFHRNAESYMISPTYANAVRPTVTGRDGNSRSFLNQLSLARSIVRGDGDSLLDQFDNEYRDQEYDGSHSRHT